VGREASSSLAKLPETFTYGSEIVLPWLFVGASFIGLLPTTVNSFFV